MSPKSLISCNKLQFSLSKCNCMYQSNDAFFKQVLLYKGGGGLEVQALVSGGTRLTDL